MDIASRYRTLNKLHSVEKEDIASKCLKIAYIVSKMISHFCFILYYTKKKTGYNARGYIPFYILYYILMALHALFAQTAFGLGRRYRRLNNALRHAFPIGNGYKFFK